MAIPYDSFNLDRLCSAHLTLRITPRVCQFRWVSLHNPRLFNNAERRHLATRFHHDYCHAQPHHAYGI